MGQTMVQLVVGEWYIIQVTGEEPKFARLEGWNGERPVFDVQDGAPGDVRATILAWIPDPYFVAPGDPPPA